VPYGFVRTSGLGVVELPVKSHRWRVDPGSPRQEGATSASVRLAVLIAIKNPLNADLMNVIGSDDSFLHAGWVRVKGILHI